jgi:hypothetical protein
MSVMVTIVLFCVALMWAMPRTTFLRILPFFAMFSSDPLWVPNRVLPESVRDWNLASFWMSDAPASRQRR